MDREPIKSLGIDIIENERIRKSLENPRFVQRILTPKERDYCKRPEQIAGRFCAKEAIMKAIGRRLSWQEIEILNDDKGRPYVILYGKAKELAEGGKILLSISHSHTLSTAVAILIEGSPSREGTP